MAAAARTEIPVETVLRPRGEAARSGLRAIRPSSGESAKEVSLVSGEVSGVKGFCIEDAIFEGSYDGLALVSPKGVILRLSRSYERITGLRAEDWIGKSCEEMIQLLGFTGPPAVLKVLEGNCPSTTLATIHNEVVLVTASSHLGKDGKIASIVVNLRNLTCLNQLKDQLLNYAGVNRNFEFSGLEDLETEQLHKLLKQADLGELVISSSTMLTVVLSAAHVARTDAGVLLCGETGTGKSVVAKLIHLFSPRRSNSFVEVNCGSIPENLVESELFGYEPGTFTGALRSGRKGRIEAANGGTLFLDEVSEFPLASQAKLLKFLDDKTLHPLGGGTRRIDTRIIAATNRDLKHRVREGKFRDDLLYRLEVVPLLIPPLRERKQDIDPLLDAFLREFNREFVQERILSAAAREALRGYDFPGNVRELRNLVARLVLTARNRTIEVEDLPADILKTAPPQPLAETRPVSPPADASNLRDQLDETERKILSNYAKQNLSTHKIAKRLGIHHSSVGRKLKKYGIVNSGPSSTSSTIPSAT